MFGYPVMALDRSELTIGSNHIEMRVARTNWEGQPAFLASLRDMTQRARAEANMKNLGTALEEANEKLERLATIDPLTETLNRRGIEKALWDELAQDKRSGSNLAAILLSCDDLNDIIENLGHAAGNILLKTIAERLRSVLRPSDQVARISRHKFLVLLPETRTAEAQQVAEKLRFAVGGSPLALSPRPLSVDMGVAVVNASQDICSIEEILELAHSALREDAESGKNPKAGSMRTMASGAIPNLLDLIRAIENGSFHAVSQPILELQSEKVVEHELLPGSRGCARNVSRLLPDRAGVEHADNGRSVLPGGLCRCQQAAEPQRQVSPEPVPIDHSGNSQRAVDGTVDSRRRWCDLLYRDQ